MMISLPSSMAFPAGSRATRPALRVTRRRKRRRALVRGEIRRERRKKWGKRRGKWRRSLERALILMRNKWLCGISWELKGVKNSNNNQNKFLKRVKGLIKRIRINKLERRRKKRRLVSNKKNKQNNK